MAMEMIDTLLLLPRETDSDLRNSFLNPPTPAAIGRQCSSGAAEEILGAENNGSPSAAGGASSQLKSPGSRSLHSIDEERGLKQPGMDGCLHHHYEQTPFNNGGAILASKQPSACFAFS
ncbi:unnamed protein product [Eruca vesicaria subsp. sativa]|uniref:Uncharacterized protein n=1 Tax=Eruca vesicaria subsp. sativa TaxID=29727 RepID=A0ABC8M500_ERUVS|nr:unnamed protein product [Eruca vesicaria subsp. sativa]